MASPEKAPAQTHAAYGGTTSPEPTEKDSSPTTIDVLASDGDGPELPAWKAYIRLWSYASPLDHALRVCGALAACAGGIAYPLMTVIFGNLVNDFNGVPGGHDRKKVERQINRNTLWLVYLFIGKVVMVYISALTYSITSARMTRRIRLRYFETVLRQDIPYFDHHTPGSVSTALSTNSNAIEVGLAEKAATIFQSATMLIAAFVIAFTKNWKLSLVCALAVPYTIVTTGIIPSIDSNIEAKIRAVHSKASSVAEEALSSVISVMALGAQDRLVTKFKGYLSVTKGYSTFRGPLQSSLYGNMFFAMFCVYSLALFYGVKLVTRGEIKDGGTVITILFAIVMGNASMMVIAPAIPDLIKAGASAQNVLKLLESNASTRAGAKSPEAGKEKLAEVTGQLRFENISFEYPSRPLVSVLNDLSVDILPGQVTAVVGHSGSGKSTLISLLERWYDPSKGDIYLDGTSIKSLDAKWWRDQIGLVQQDPVLFNDTIYENVLNGLPDDRLEQLSEDQKRALVVDACTQANAHEFITTLPSGYDTPLGDRASLLSGGQRQRITIARSIIANPKILLLDEPTSALDSESEAAVQAALEKAARGRTTLMIAHKLSTVENADKIIVMDKGRVVEEGTHSELQGVEDGHYAKLLKAQNAGAQTDGSEDGSRDGVDQARAQGLNLELTRTGTLAPLAPAAEVPDLLDSKLISRRYSLVKCISIILSGEPRMILFFVSGLLASLVSSSAFPVLAFLFSKLVSVFQLSGEDRVKRGNFWAGMFFVLACAIFLSHAVTFYLLSVAGAASGRKYRAKYLRAMLDQDIDFYQTAGNSSGVLNSLLFNDGDDLETMISLNVGLLAVFVVDLLACCVLALAIGWKLALVAIFGCLPPLLLAGFLRMRADRQAQDRCAKFFLESARFSTEAVGAIRTVASLTMEGKVVERYKSRLTEALNSSSKRVLGSMILFALSDSLDLIVMALAFWYGGRLVTRGELSVSRFFIVFVSIIFGGQSAGYTFGYTGSINKAQAAANRIIYMDRRRPVINSSTGIDPKSVHTAGTAIEFKNVYFRYPTRPDVGVHRRLNFTIRRGENVCIVGPSGCGKSTIISLIERFYDIVSGELLVYGKPIADFDIKALRSTFGLVSQETTLYQGTVKENLLLGVDGEVSEEEIISACKDANIHDFIVSLPESYSTDCGPRGLAFSGGQRQRMAIARALLRNPDILLLDEATSALDPESEGLVRDSLDKVAVGRTMISITHQVETMKRADRIIVMERGRVIEDGTWTELMASKGRFWGMQVRGELIKA